MNDPDHLLSGREALKHLGADGPEPYLLYEILDNLEIDVRLKENQPHFAQGILDILLGHDPLAAELFKDQIKFVGKAIEH
jgi:hypothetical protein